MLIEATQANTNKPIYISVKKIYCAFYSEAMKATCVLADGGAQIFVTDTLDSIISQWKNQPKEKEENERS